MSTGSLDSPANVTCTQRPLARLGPVSAGGLAGVWLI